MMMISYGFLGTWNAALFWLGRGSLVPGLGGCRLRLFGGPGSPSNNTERGKTGGRRRGEGEKERRKEGGREERREGRKEGGRKGEKEGRREGGKERRKEGGREERREGRRYIYIYIGR